MKGKIIEVLKDLIQLNGERVEEYEDAANRIKDLNYAEVKIVFFQLAEESRSYRFDLLETVGNIGARATEVTAGKIYKVWMDAKTSCKGDNLSSVLESCEVGEDAALKAYQQALQAGVDWPTEISSLLANQYQSLRASHDRIKRYREEFRIIDYINTH